MINIKPGAGWSWMCKIWGPISSHKNLQIVIMDLAGSCAGPFSFQEGFKKFLLIYEFQFFKASEKPNFTSSVLNVAANLTS